MGSFEAGSTFVLLDEKLRRDGMSRETYRRTADAFLSLDAPVSPKLLLCILEHFVRFQGDLLYVNEIRNFLKENSPSLFKEYGRRFASCKGCFDVFGVESVDVVDYDFKVKMTEERKIKEYGGRKRRARNSIKRQAKAHAALNFKKRLDEKRERRKKNEEINEMIRRQNI